MNEQTTQLKPLRSGPAPETVTIYAPDGSEHRCAPVDAREILAGGQGYTAAAPQDLPDEQQSEQQPVASDAPSEATQSESAPTTGEAIVEAAFESVTAKRNRSRK